MARPPAGGARVPLGTFGSTTLSFSDTDAPWSLPVDAFTLPAGATTPAAGGLRPTLDGGLAHRLRSELGAERFARLERLVAEAAVGVPFGPADPVVVELPEDLRLGERASHVFVATALGPDPQEDEAWVEHAALASAAIVRRAWRDGIPRIAVVPVGGRPGLEAAVAMSTLHAALEAGPYSGGAEIVFTGMQGVDAAQLASVLDDARAELAAGRPRIWFGRLDLEPQVHEALIAARSLASEAGAVRPAHVLQAILATRASSPAFEQIRAWVHLVPRPVLREDARSVPESEGQAFSFSPDLYEQIVYAASNRGARANRAIWGRELVTAVLLAGGAELEELLAQGDLKLTGLRDRWYEFVRADDRVRTRASWDAWWAFAGVPRPGEHKASISVAATGSDDPWAGGLGDRLGVGEEAKAFARLAAAKAFQPPLAIGVFGEWGSGKSFFMRLVNEHVERLRGAPCAEAPEAGGAAFLRDIVQVRFNAWHYVDTNLWASLVDHLFTELDRWVREREEPKAPDRLLENLATARELTLEAAEELVRHRKEQREAADRLARADQALKGARASAVGSAEVWWAALQEAIEAPHDPADERLERSKADFQEAARELGLEEVEKNAQAFEAASEALASEVGRARLLRKGLFDLLQRRWVVVWFVIACLAIPGVLVYVREWLTQWLPRLGALHVVFVEVGGALATAALLLGAAARRVRSAVNLLGRSKAAMDKAVAKRLQAPSGAVKRSQAELTRLTAEAEEARALLATTSDRLAEAAREYASGTGAGRLLRFIRARATDGQYARHLGLVASIRKDFEELAAGIAAASEQSRNDVKASRAAFRRRVIALVRASRDHLTPQEQRTLLASARRPPAAQKAFQRIVLYIDDLDRCPPRKVVEVLQAVHMLLTFPLFVVVVAVDVRWVSRALERHYPDLLEPTGGGRIGAGRAASAHDYLEKIFQIPYWVRPMSEKASRAFLDDRSKGLAPAPAPSARASESLRAEPPAPEGAPVPSSPATDSSLAGPGPAVQVATAILGSASGAGVQEGRATGTPLPTLDARALALDGAERAFMKRLAPFVGGSPRRALRFLNVYCVVKASLGREDLDRLEAGGHRALMTQLAIATGAPQALPAWLHALRDATSLDAAREALDRVAHARDDTDRERLAGALSVFAAASSDVAAQAKELRAYAEIARRYSFTG